MNKYVMYLTFGIIIILALFYFMKEIEMVSLHVMPKYRPLWHCIIVSDEVLMLVHHWQHDFQAIQEIVIAYVVKRILL